MLTKICSKCKKELPLENFSKNKNSKDGLYLQCRDCKNEKRRAEAAKKKEGKPPKISSEHYWENGVEMKACTKCGLGQPLCNFAATKEAKDGLAWWCKKCFSDWGKQQKQTIVVFEKKCTKCRMIKPSHEFHFSSRSKDGLSAWCRDCHFQHYEDNKEQIFARQKAYNLEHPEVHKKAATKYYETNTEEVKARSSAFYYENREEILAENRGNPVIAAKRKARRLANLPKALEKEREFRAKRRAEKREEINRVNNAWTKKKLIEDPSFKLGSRLRSRINKIIKRNQRAGSAIRDLGCSVEQLKAHLEKQFLPGMTWKNWGHGKGKWNIDHIMPLAAFDLTNRQHFLLACNYLNLRPLWHIDNMRKGKKIIPFPNQNESTQAA